MQLKINKSTTGFIILLFSVVACSKEEVPANLPEGEIYVSAQIGDEQWRALEYESALNLIPGRGQYFELSSFNSKYRLDLSVFEFDKCTGTISEGTYEDDIFFSIFLLGEEGDILVEYKPEEAIENPLPPFKITVTASTNSRISGTFSGLLMKASKDADENYPETLIITNGIFNNLPFETNTVNVQ